MNTDYFAGSMQPNYASCLADDGAGSVQEVVQVAWAHPKGLDAAADDTLAATTCFEYRNYNDPMDVPPGTYPPPGDVGVHIEYKASTNDVGDATITYVIAQEKGHFIENENLVN